MTEAAHGEGLDILGSILTERTVTASRRHHEGIVLKCMLGSKRAAILKSSREMIEPFKVKRTFVSVFVE